LRNAYKVLVLNPKGGYSWEVMRRWWGKY